MGLPLEAILVGLAISGGGIVYYLYRKKSPFSESTLDELEDSTLDGGFRYTPEYGIFVAIVGLFLVGFGLWAWLAK